MQGQVDAAARTTISVWGMFEHSDIFMKILMIAMVLASVWSWAIIFNKIKTFRRVKEQSKIFENKFWSGNSLDALYEKFGDERMETFRLSERVEKQRRECPRTDR